VGLRKRVTAANPADHVRHPHFEAPIFKAQQGNLHLLYSSIQPSSSQEGKGKGTHQYLLRGKSDIVRRALKSLLFSVKM
jgi:hypothetical protein